MAKENMQLLSGEVINSGQVEIGYKTESSRELTVEINGVQGLFQINGESSLFFDINEGNNTVYAEFVTDNLVSFVLDTEVYVDLRPPEIKLFDDIDGKTFYTDTATILGKVTGANAFTINGTNIDLEAGTFAYSAELILGENLIEMEAVDTNGNSTKMVLTLYKGSNFISGADSKKGWIQFLPLIAAALTSILIIVLSFAFMKKKDKVQGEKKHRIWPLILWDILVLLADIGFIWQYIRGYFYSNSMSYLELAEKSVSEASRHLRLEKILGMASGVGLLIFVISVIITIFVVKRSKKSNNQVKEGV